MRKVLQKVAAVIHKTKPNQNKKLIRMEKSNRKLPNKGSKELEENKNMMAFLNLIENIKSKNKRDKNVKTKSQRSKRKDSLKNIDQFITID